MSDFTCTLKIPNFPAEVRPGSMIKVNAQVEASSAPVRSVIFAVDAYGIRQAFKKLEDGSFALNFMVPFEAPRGNYKVAVWAVSEEGEKSAVSSYQVAIK